MCNFCSIEFEPIKAWQKFCSEVCGNKYREAFADPRFSAVLDINEAAEIMQLTPNAIRYKIRTGQLRAIRKSGRIFIARHETEKLKHLS